MPGFRPLQAHVHSRPCRRAPVRSPPEDAPRRALGRDRVRCRRRDGVRARRCPMRRSRLPIFTMSNGAVSSLPVRCCARVLSPSFFLSASRSPDRGGGGAPGGASLEHVALVKRDATLARRGPSRATGRPPLGAPPWRCRPGSASIAGIAAGSGAKAPRNRANARPRPRRLVSAGYEPRSTPLPAPPAGSSPETPLMSEDEVSL